MKVFNNSFGFGELSKKLVSGLDSIIWSLFLHYEAGWLLKVFWAHVFPFILFFHVLYFLVGYSKGGLLGTQSTPCIRPC